MRLFYLALLALSLVAADTEIVNLRVPLPSSLALQPTTEIVNLIPGTRHTDVVSTNRTDVYYALTLPEGSWTARISWPASTPTRFKLAPFAQDRTTVFHVHAAPLSPRVPYHGVEDAFETTFHILVEPLIFGFLPRTAVSAVTAIIVFVAGAAMLAPRALAAMQGLARWVDEDERLAEGHAKAD